MTAQLTQTPALAATLRSQLSGQTALAADPAAAEGPDATLVSGWIARLQLLHGVPTHHLIPDPAMLPTESIRFFQVDPNWIAALTDGALAVGAGAGAAGPTSAALPALRAAAATAAAGLRSSALGAAATAPDTGQDTPTAIGGFLLRSSALAGWPGLEVRGYADAAGQQALPVLRLEALSSTLLLALFTGPPARVDLLEPSETLHFGTGTPPNGLTVVLRGVGPEGAGAGAAVTVPTRAGGTVVQVNALAAAMATATSLTSPGAFTGAHFAFEMVQGAECVSFRLSTS